MCGIFALFSKVPLTDDLVELGRSGMRALAHRGPDAQGEFIDRERGVFLGHVRLKIIDLSDAAAQPMTRDRHTIVYNGEFYGFEDVRRELAARGETFRSNSDTEVVLAAWQTWGPRAVDRLDGMFAFVVWDGEEAWLVADHFGEKTLFVATTEWGVAVSSELEPLRRLLSAEADIGGTVVNEFLALGYVAAPRTFYRNILRLPAASRARIARGELSAPTRYWQLPVAEPRTGRVRPVSDSELDEIEEALTVSIARRLIADVPLCLFLSSGVDSALIAAIVSRKLRSPVRCLTVDSPSSAAHDESDKAARVARYLALDHVVVAQPPMSADLDLGAVLRCFGQPNDNIAVSAVSALAAAAQENGHKVGLTGIGGDEIFRGYQKQSFAWSHRRAYALPEWSRLLVGRALAPLRSRDSRFEVFCSLFALPDSLRYLALKNLSGIDWLRRIPGFDGWAQAQFPRGGNFSEFVGRFEIEHVLPGSQLPAADIGSMSRGVELRTPFLDKNLAEVVARRDPRALLAFGQKSVLRRLLGRYVPPELTTPGKIGLVIPLRNFLSSRAQPASLPVAVGSSWLASLWAQRETGSLQRLALRAVLLHEFMALHGSRHG